MKQIRYEVCIVENEDGWHVTGMVLQGVGADQIALGGIERIITYSTLEQAIKAAHGVIDGLAASKNKGLL